MSGESMETQNDEKSSHKYTMWRLTGSLYRVVSLRHMVHVYSRSILNLRNKFHPDVMMKSVRKSCIQVHGHTIKELKSMYINQKLKIDNQRRLRVISKEHHPLRRRHI